MWATYQPTHHDLGKVCRRTGLKGSTSIPHPNILVNLTTILFKLLCICFAASSILEYKLYSLKFRTDAS